MNPATRSALNGQTAFTFYSFVLGFALPLMLILIFYVLVIVKLKTVGPKNKSKERRKSHRKVTRLVLTVITVYILCWLPYWITQLALIFTPPGQSHVSKGKLKLKDKFKRPRVWPEITIVKVPFLKPH